MIRKSKFPNEILQEYPELLDECKLSRSIIENKSQILCFVYKLKLKFPFQFSSQMISFPYLMF